MTAQTFLATLALVVLILVLFGDVYVGMIREIGHEWGRARTEWRRLRSEWKRSRRKLW